MESQKLNDKERKNVNGGQADFPLRSNEENMAVAENFVSAVNRFGRCRVCGSVLTFPPTGHGTCICECGAEARY